jgi:hypothetical protein
MMSEQDKLKEEAWWIAYNDCKLSHIAHIQDYFKAGYEAAPKGIDKEKLIEFCKSRTYASALLDMINNGDFDMKGDL